MNNPKLQVIVPCFLEPLLCQLYFRNYAKYKNQHVDRLIILIGKHASTNFLMSSSDHSHWSKEYRDKIFDELICDLKNLLAELNINNYTIIDTVGDVEHGIIFDAAIDYIQDENYHTLFDEQDAYWLSDTMFKNYGSMLQQYDVVGGIKSPMNYLDTPERVQKFNKRFGVNHDLNYIPILFLPEFVSNSVIKKMEFISGKSCGFVDPTEFCDVNDVTPAGQTLGLDTFQLFNLEVFKKTAKINVCIENVWDIRNDLQNGLVSNYDGYVLYHAFASRLLASQGFWCDFLINHIEITEKYLTQMVGTTAWSLRNCIYYQALDLLPPSFKHKANYLKNYDLFGNIRPEFNLKNYDCSKLLQIIL